MLDTLKEKPELTHLKLPKNDFAHWTGGNLLGRDPETGAVERIAVEELC